jgi:hypothetical protein
LDVSEFGMMPQALKKRGFGAGWSAILIVAAITPSGCRTFQSTVQAPAPPKQNLLVVDAFRISSSSPIADDDSIARELIDLRMAVQSILQLAGPIRPVEIYIFDDRACYERFIQTYYPDLPRRRAFFMAQDRRELVYAFRDRKLVEDLRHEVCHALLHSAVGPVPLWLDEGLAEYFETPGDSRGLHPRHVTELQTALRQGWRPSLTRLEGLTQLRQMAARDYREAWGWVYWLLNDSPDGHQILLDYLQEVRAGSARDPLSARVFAVTPRPDLALISLVTQLEPGSIVTTGVARPGQEM